MYDVAHDDHDVVVVAVVHDDQNLVSVVVVHDDHVVSIWANSTNTYLHVHKI